MLGLYHIHMQEFVGGGGMGWGFKIGSSLNKTIYLYTNNLWVIYSRGGVAPYITRPYHIAICDILCKDIRGQCVRG